MSIQLLELSTYFIIYSFLGWVLESIFRSFCEKKIINTGFLRGPICPIYGCGAIIMIFFLKNFSSSKILLFIMSIIFLSLWEYIVGVILEKLFKTKYWDYSDHKFNYKGRICLTNSIAWGFLGVLFIDFIHPAIVNLLKNVDVLYLKIIVPILLILILTDAIISIVKTKNIKGTLEKVEKLNEQIKEKLAEIKKQNQEKNTTSENLQLLIEKINKRKNRELRRLYKRVYRLKRAFPAIDTKEFRDILNRKIELKNKKNKNE
ncbi:MAG: putative ABC transporter permease [Clostridia bacterium]|nr:hypothetical protein [Clostridium sp.]